jgi:hypothetical protein
VNDKKLLIADLGLSKKLAEVTTHSKGNTHGMPQYIEPQCYKIINYKKNEKSDIYSLGILLWEISSGRLPFSKYSMDLLREHIKGGGREEPIKGTPTEYQKLYQECWSDKPESRPDIEKAHEILSSELLKNSKEPSDQLSHPINIDDINDNDDLTISSSYPSINLTSRFNILNILINNNDFY